MQRLALVESVWNRLDIGIYMEIWKHARKVRINMAPGIFMKHLFFGKGYHELTPPRLSRKLNHPETAPLIVDLREKHKFRKGHIKGAVLHLFDDFLGEVLMDDGYADYKDRLVVLVCDTGQKSRVAASILSDEGFTRVVSLNRGMRRWSRWEWLLSRCGQEQGRVKKFHICNFLL
jgi:rhodanese-related sulfurtransferase